MTDPPDEAEVLSYFERLSNWGRWGDEDQAGTLNLITPEHRVAAARLVSEGRTVSCAREIVTAYGHPDNNAQMHFVSTGQGVDPVESVPETAFGNGDVAAAVEYFGLVFHGLNVTHVDAPSHLFLEGAALQRPSRRSRDLGVRCAVVRDHPDGQRGRGSRRAPGRATGRGCGRARTRPCGDAQ
jgi:hypothetical protein